MRSFTPTLFLAPTDSHPDLALLGRISSVQVTTTIQTLDQVRNCIANTVSHG
jgi:hypothetical protein